MTGDASETAETEEQAAPPRVLLVEDNETNRRVIACILNLVNADLTWAENGLEGVNAYRSQDFDVVLMDLQMPVMDGFTATREIRAFETTEGRARTPLIVVSANTRPEDVSAAREAGADAHLGKPVDVTALLTAISEAMEAAQAYMDEQQVRTAQAG